jgi:hypothetical protein
MNKKIFVKDGQWFCRLKDGTEEFCPNSCCKCCVTTDSQRDRFCDDCFIIAPWYEKYPLPTWIMALVGVFALIRIIVDLMNG